VPRFRPASAIAVIAALLATAACTASKARPHVVEPRPRAVETPCRASIDELDAWLRTLEAEQEVRSLLVPKPGDDGRLLDRALPAVSLVRLEAPSAPIPANGALVLSPRKLTFIDESADITNAAALTALLRHDHLQESSPGFGGGGGGRSYFVRPIALFIEENVRWTDVVRVFAALGREGFGPLDLVFAAQTRTSPPPDSESLRRFVAIATSQDEMPWEQKVHAARTLEELHPRCPRLADPVRATPDSSAEIAEQSTDFVARAATLARECDCGAVDVRAVKAFAWTRFGRHWGPLTTSVSVDNARAEEIAGARGVGLPANMPWREAYRPVLDAAATAKEGGAKLSFIVRP
jgi:hypothetical protein